MKVFIFIAIWLTLFALVRSIKNEEEENQMITVYKTVTASSHADEIQNKEGPTALSSNKQAIPTMSSKSEEELTTSSGENKYTTTPITAGENINDDTEPSLIPEFEIQAETEDDNEEEDEQEEDDDELGKDTNKAMRMAPEVSSEKDGISDKKSSLVSETPSKSASRSGSVFASGSTSLSKETSSSSTTGAYSSAFSFSPITLAPESTKPSGAKATAVVMNKASAKTEKKHISSALRVTPPISLIIFILVIFFH